MSTGTPVVIAALSLGCYALIVAVLAPFVLARFWPSDRAPRLTLTLLQILSCSFLVAGATTFLAFAVAGVDRLASMSPAIDACADQLPIDDESPVGAVIGHLCLAATVILTARLAYCLLSTFGRARRRRRAHIDVLRMCARPDPDLGVFVLDHPDPACYCLPGRPGMIVITDGALGRLSANQLQAVLEHERAHLAGRHHLVVALAFAVRRTVPRVPLLSYAERETRRLVELIADDAAARHSGAPTVAAALAVIGVGHVPGGGAEGSILAIGSSPTVARVSRLMGAKRALEGRMRALSILAATAAVAVPIVVGTMSVTSVVKHCPAVRDNEKENGQGTYYSPNSSGGGDNAPEAEAASGTR